jgi:hypothetical protein
MSEAHPHGNRPEVLGRSGIFGRRGGSGRGEILHPRCRAGPGTLETAGPGKPFQGAEPPGRGAPSIDIIDIGYQDDLFE